MTKKNLLENISEFDEALSKIELPDFSLNEPLVNKQEPLRDIFSTVTEKELHALTNFELKEFRFLLTVVEEELVRMRSNKGRKIVLSDNDLLLLFLCYLKTYNNGTAYSTFFKVTPETINRLLNKMIERFHKPLTSAFIIPENFKKADQSKLFPDCRLIIDCSVQEVSRYRGTFSDVKIFYSGKHGMYCLKREYAHALNGEVVFISEAFPGSKHDFSIFLKNVDYYKSLLKKDGTENQYWGIIADKGYEGINKYINAITPIKGNNLTTEEMLHNRRISSVRIICENYYGRLKVLWGAARDKIKSCSQDFEKLNDICAALTNFHIRNHPLRNSDLVNLRKLDISKLKKQDDKEQKENNLDQKKNDDIE